MERLLALIDKIKVRCRGRNGFFQYNETSCTCLEKGVDTGEPEVYLEFYSKQIGNSAPIQLMGHPEDVKALLLDALDKIDPPKTVVTDPKVKDIGALL